MLLTRREWLILVVNAAYVSIFSVITVRRLNFEFMLYVGVILLVGALVVWKQRTVGFDGVILWGLTLWGMMHLAGGNITVGDGVLYGVEFVSLVPNYQVIRYDQVVHLLGFGVATLVCHHLLRPHLKEHVDHWGTLSFLIVLMGCGFGALNEIIEFLAVAVMPETGVGGYENTMLDLVFNLIGAALAVAWLAVRRSAREPSSQTVT